MSRGGKLGFRQWCLRGGYAAALAILMMECGAAWGGELFPLGERVPAPELSDQPLPYLSAGDLPSRPSMPLELGDHFLDSGALFPGIDMPGGATWQPRLWIFGTYRTAVQAFADGKTQPVSEWANRLDVFANLQLTGTERLVVGLRPLDRGQSGQFSGATIAPAAQSGGNNYLNANIKTLFFEGDFGSTFPDLDLKGTEPIDFGYSIGRQPFLFQNGILINDTIDAAGLARNSVHLPGTSNSLFTGVFGWNKLHRPNRPVTAEQPQMYGLFSTVDAEQTTYDLDTIFVGDKSRFGSALYIGASMIQRVWLLDTTFRVNNSIATGKETAVSTNGTLVSGEFAYTLPNSNDIVYLNPYVALNNYTQASKDPIAGGPLAPLGILYAAYGIGTSRSALSSAAWDVAGAALGYQAFWDDKRRNLTLEIGGRKDTGNKSFDAVGAGAQYQQALTRRILWQVNATIARQDGRNNNYGLRTEILYQF
ncbi:MAG: hypothetical protein ACHQF3_01870 [Alphaproteobacteria bacterium]